MQVSETVDFDEHMKRLRLGDTSAIGAFVDLYEPFIRRTLRFRIHDASLQSAADSVDLCQSVLGGFLLRFAAGDYAIANEQDLRRLLGSIANKKFLMFQRRERADKRDRYRTQSLESVSEPQARTSCDASLQLQQGELLQEAMRRLSEDELELFQLRCNGTSWAEISERFHGSEIVLRQRLSRAIRRVSAELGIDDDD